MQDAASCANVQMLRDAGLLSLEMLDVVPLPQSLDIEDARNSDQHWLDILHNSR